MEKIGSIGLGIMGAPMAEKPLQSGLFSRGNDINPAAVRRLVELGAAEMSCQEMGRCCDVVFTILPYVIFPGNVGGDESLRAIVESFMTTRN